MASESYAVPVDSVRIEPGKTPGGMRTLETVANNEGIGDTFEAVIRWTDEGEWTPSKDPSGIGDFTKEKAVKLVACLVQAASLETRDVWIPLASKDSKYGNYLGFWPQSTQDVDVEDPETDPESYPLYWCVADAPFGEGDEIYGGLITDGVSMYAQCVDWKDALATAESLLAQIEEEEGSVM